MYKTLDPRETAKARPKELTPERDDSGNIMDRKRPLGGLSTSFTSSFGRNKKSNPASSPGDGNTTATSSISNGEKPSSTSKKPAVKDLVSWIEHLDASPANKDQKAPDIRAPSSISCLPSFSGTTHDISSAGHENPENTVASSYHKLSCSPEPPPIPARSVRRPNPDIIPTCVPGTDEHQLTLREYKQFFSQRAPDNKPTTIVRRKSPDNMTLIISSGEEGNRGSLNANQERSQKSLVTTEGENEFWRNYYFC